MKRVISGRVNVGQESYTPLAYVNQLDDIRLELDIYSNNSPLDVTGQTVSLYAKRSNKTVVEQLEGFSIANSKVTGDVKNSCFAVPGITEMQLEFIDSNGKTTVSSFYIHVNKSLSSEDSITANNEIGILTEAKEKEPIRQQNELERIKNESARVKSEADRAAAEKIREQQESSRQTCYKEIEESRVDFDGEIHKDLKLRLLRDFGDIYERFNKANLLPYEGQYITANNSYKGVTKDNVVKGRTLQNLVDHSNKYLKAGSAIIDRVIDTTQEIKAKITSSSSVVFYKPCLLEPNTQYVIIFEAFCTNAQTITVAFKQGTNFMTNHINKAITGSYAQIVAEITTGEGCTDITIGKHDIIPIGTEIGIKNLMVFKIKPQPIPPYFEGIKSVNEDGENMEVVSCGKNLLNINNQGIHGPSTILTYIDTGFIAKGRWYVSLKIKPPLDKSKKYYLSFNKEIITQGDTTGEAKLFNFTTNKSCSNAISSSGIMNLTDDYNSSDDISIIFYVGNGTTDGEIKFTNVQIEEGTTATTYEPHQEHRLPIKMKNLRSLPNGVCDLSTGERKIGKSILNGIEGWTIRSDKDKPNTVLFLSSNPLPNCSTNLNNTNVISDKFVNSNVFDVNIEGIYTHNSFVFIRVLKSKLSTADIAGFKSWLQANPTTVYYELATPTTEEGNTEQLRTYDGQTNIFIENSLIEPPISCKVPSNVQAVVMSLQEENEALNNEVITLQATEEENNLTNIETSLEQDARLTMLELGVI